MPIYLLHRYQVEAVARLIAGGEFEYGLAQDANQGRIKRALKWLMRKSSASLCRKCVRVYKAEQLALPSSVLDALTPQSEGFSKTRNISLAA